jgi:hypothetical protein
LASTNALSKLSPSTKRAAGPLRGATNDAISIIV